MLDVKKVSITIFTDMPDMSGKYNSFFKWALLNALLACIRDYHVYANSKNVLNSIFALLRYYIWSTVNSGIAANSLALQDLPAGKTAVGNLASIIS
jgi:hypothetical protein